MSKFDLNKTFNKDLRVYVVAKDDDENIWPTSYAYKDQANWSYRCTPQLNGQIGGQGGIQGYDNGGQAPAQLNNLKIKSAKPKRAKINN